MKRWRVGVLTASDKGARGEREDLSGEEIRSLIPRMDGEVVVSEMIADDWYTIRQRLITFADQIQVDLIVTTGGTGFAPRDVTPEATRSVIDKEAPGLAEAMRMASLKKTRYALLSRAVVGIRGKTLIINLPGSPKAVRECLEAIIDVLPHGLDVLTGHVGDHG
ncbi:molybdopterin adenylyltransferase [Marininema mesophilum]|uniref:Molybdopterin adenylyltransferase n=1 Tax=Marininema mesophilum TaxID=1048340 RepID=A0A1H3AX58_9BACL|nr:MogA/MoaB family molybdenum cofactor biosynthesis protein [Marininema mesophilum]SDX34320.1 molybdopterin adenylyltransferase [Marininema mesophilum]